MTTHPYPTYESMSALLFGEGNADDPEIHSLLETARSSADIIDMGGVEDIMDEGDFVFIDIRTAEEFAEGHIEDSVNVPLSEMSPDHEALPEKDVTIIAVCSVGQRSLRGMLLLKSMGYPNVKSLMGGLQSWVAEGNLLEEP